MQGFNMTVFNLIEKKKTCISLHTARLSKDSMEGRLKIIRKKHGFDGSEAEMEVSAAVSTENR
jgi:hypothetical protein